MKILLKVGSLIFYLVFTFVITAAVSSLVLKKPVLISSVLSNSMYPLFQRGDMILLGPALNKNSLAIGDIIVFRTKDGSYDTKGFIVHRIISGSSKDGFITKGDANNYTDQAFGLNPPIKLDWIANRVLTINGYPLKIPLIGQLPLLVMNYYKSPFMIPVIVLIVGTTIGLSELKTKSKKRLKTQNLNIQLIYFLSGLTISILVFATMLIRSQNLNINYGVSESSKGILSGSDIGILKVGETLTIPLSKLYNKSIIPTTAILVSKDNQIMFSQGKVTLKSGMEINPTLKITAQNPGLYNSTIHIGMFLPLLPKAIIYNIAKKNYWLVLIILSLIPGLPIMLQPLLNSKLRRKTIKEIRRNLRRIKISYLFGLIKF